MIPDGWSYATIESVCARVTSGGTPSHRKRPEFYGGDIPWVKTQELQDGWVRSTEERLTQVGLDSSSAKLLPANTILMAMYGATVGKLGVLADEMTCNQASCALIVDPEVASFRFLFYRLLLERSAITILATGAAQQNLNAGTIKSAQLLFPPLEEQERIAGVLGAFDDLIETNRRLSGDLLALLFARYEALGRQQPSTTFGSVARLVRDQWKPGSGGPERYLGLEHFATEGGGLIGHGSSSGVQSVSLRFARGDVLYGKLRPYFRKVARPGFDGLCSSEVWVLRAQEGYPQSLVHALAHSPRFSEVAMAGSGGTRMPRADWTQVSALPVPDLGAGATMSQTDLNGLEALWSAACELDDESRDLVRQRDELLPLLMSGKVRVRDVEAAVS